VIESGASLAGTCLTQTIIFTEFSCLEIVLQTARANCRASGARFWLRCHPGSGEGGRRISTYQFARVN
jgi:hypothetical protein